jgi:Holliday junction resolvase RusA-like endonuclease
MKAFFTVPGEPIAKGRPRMTRAGHVYTPQKTADYENSVKKAYGDNPFFSAGHELRSHVKAFFQIPKSAGKAKTAAMESGQIRPVKRPDCDNVAKAICDALNGVAYHDDAQVVELVIDKWYALKPRVEVEIQEWDD